MSHTMEVEGELCDVVSGFSSICHREDFNLAQATFDL